MTHWSDFPRGNTSSVRRSNDSLVRQVGPYLQIAAIALANNLTLVTHNAREFSRVPGLLLEDWGRIKAAGRG